MLSPSRPSLLKGKIIEMQSNLQLNHPNHNPGHECERGRGRAGEYETTRDVLWSLTSATILVRRQ